MELTRIRGAEGLGGLRRQSAPCGSFAGADGELESPCQSSRGSNSGRLAPPGHQVIVKNTFLTVVDAQEDEPSSSSMVRSVSDSDLASSSARSRALEQESRCSRRSRDRSFTPSHASSDANQEEEAAGEQSETPSTVEPEAAGEAGVKAKGDAKEGEWSVGAALHATKQCRPCIYLNSEVGCSFGAKCRFCHLTHKRKTRQRPCKTTRAECKRMVDALHSVFDNEGDKIEEVSKKLGSQSNYMKQILRGRQQAAQQQQQQQLEQASSSSGRNSSTRLSL